MVIPVYRSQESLPLLTERLLAALGALDREFEIIYVDDCSPDDSWQALESLKKKHPGTITIDRLPSNIGQHNAILHGFSLVTGQVIVTMDDDLQNPPEEIHKLVHAVDQGCDLAIAAYACKKHSRARNIFGFVIDGFQKKLFHLPRGFQLTSFRAAKRAVVDRVVKQGGAFPYITCMLLANASSYTNVVTEHHARRFGTSTYTLKRSLRLAANLVFSMR